MEAQALSGWVSVGQSIRKCWALAVDISIEGSQGMVWPGMWWRSPGGAVYLAGPMPISDTLVAPSFLVVVGVTEAKQALGREIGFVGQEIAMT